MTGGSRAQTHPRLTVSRAGFFGKFKTSLKSPFPSRIYTQSRCITRFSRITASWVFLDALGLAVWVQAQSFVNTASVVDSAGGASESASYSNISAIGQPFGFDENSSASYVN